MRRLILELSGPGFERFKAASPLRNIKSLEMLHLLRLDEEEIAAICRIEFLDSASKGAAPARRDSSFPFEVQILEKEKDGGLVAFLRGEPRLDLPPLNLIHKGGYISGPFEIRDGRAKVTFLAENSSQMRAFLQGVEKSGIRYKIVSLTDAKFSPDSPLHGLTQKQLKAVITAFKLGYYNVPRRINSEALAERLGVVPATLNVHLRKAELHLLSEILG
jgi:hypothetical protein